MKIKKLFVLLVLLFITSVKAEECSYKEKAELSSLAGQVTATYEIKTSEIESGVLPIEDQPSTITIQIEDIVVNITNIDPKLYVVVYNNKDSEEKTITYNDTENGLYTFVQEDNMEIYNYTIEVYSVGSDSCGIEKYRTLYLKTPKKNPYAELGYCNGLEKVDLCADYILFEEPDMDSFVNQMHDYTNKNAANNDSETVDNNESFFNNNKTYIYIASGVVLVGIAIIVIYKVRGKHHEK